MKHRFIHSLIVNLIVSAALHAAPITFQQKPAPTPSGEFTRTTEKSTDAPGTVYVREDGSYMVTASGNVIKIGTHGIAGECACDLPAAAEQTTISKRPKLLWLIPVGLTGLLFVGLVGRTDDSTRSIQPTPEPISPITPQPSPTPSANVPEPASLTLLGLGLALAGLRLQRKRK